MLELKDKPENVMIYPRTLLPLGSLESSELVLIQLTSRLLPLSLTLIVVIGIIAATISTLDSILIAITAIIDRDLRFSVKPFEINPHRSLLIAVVAVFGTWFFGFSSVFSTTFSSWSLVAAIYLPVLLFRVNQIPISEQQLWLTTLLAIVILVVWKYLELNLIVYELAPALVPSLAVLGWNSLVSRVKFTSGIDSRNQQINPSQPSP